MSRGLLGGGTSPGQSNYSSDEEDSDTEEYMQSKLDMMTGGPAKDGASALEGMTDEEKEKEARELHDLIQKLNEKGIIQMAPLGSDNQPIKLPPPPPDDDNDSDPE
ncbi:PREDICTED: synembryn-A-like [Amphimedon queenslandica]|uniref:Uncharacterized protein n=1 Tax=Amphimedon queenslandica TaxID=400682 RepID=A0A1X7U9C4_AMPQE|nr:PREDICTED: synembryn-A-like [Amphimedon queenslandica]|eukprot:XP_019855493.1 PREDICTED: synembryn-A-like [Amphimedon queenslandica]